MFNRTVGAGRDGRTAQQVERLPWPLHQRDQLEREHSDAALRESDRLFRTTFDRAVVGIAHTALDGRWLRVNQRLCDLLGYTREELAVRTFEDVTHPNDLDVSRECFRCLLAGEQDDEELDKRYLRKDGALVWAHVTVSLVRTAEGKPDYFITMVQDITERRRLEQERMGLLEEERVARREAEAANASRAALQTLTDTALSHLALDDLLRELLGRVTDVMGVDQVGILLLDADGRTLTLRAARGLLEAAPGYDQFAMGQGFPGRIAASRESLVIDAPSADDFDGAPPVLREQLHSAAGVPLLVETWREDQAVAHPVSRLVGVLVVGSATQRRFTEADVQLLQRAADRIALAIDRAHLYAGEQDARRQAEAALARAQASEAQASERAERLNTIVETMADGVAVYDADGRSIQSNRAYRGLFATERAPAGFETMTAGERARLLDMRDATGAPLAPERTPAGRALQGEVVTGRDADVRLRAFDGRELEVNNSAAPLRDPDGRVAGVVLVLRDMTERNQLAREREAAHAQAERQAEQLDRIFETAADGLVVWDAEGHMMRVNSAARRLLGLDAAPPEFTQLPLRERFARYALRDEHGRPLPPEEWPGMRTLHAGMATGIETGTEPVSETEARVIRLRALDGRERELHDTAAPLHDRDGRLVGAVCVMHDVTERNRLEREREAARADELAAREASRRLEEFLATAAHDLRAPLAAAVGFLDLAQHQVIRLAARAEAESPALAQHVTAVRGRLQDADQSTARLTRLLGLLFDTTAVRAGRLELHRAPVDLVALLQEQVAALRVTASERIIRLRAPASGEPISVEADADRIGQVATNYVTNALKYSRMDRPVDVTVAAYGRWARVTVRDRGPGLPPAERERVWELFHRAPGVAAQNGMTGGSLGLGLHISQAIIAAHGGRVGVTSAVGKGSTFWFVLPLSGPPPSLHGVAAARGAMGRYGKVQAS
jgi:PAS domain S-box-containing protein